MSIAASSSPSASSTELDISTSSCLRVLARQDATFEFDTASEERCTFDEGTHSPASQQSLSSDDFKCSPFPQEQDHEEVEDADAPVSPQVAERPPIDFEAFDQMVQEQQATRKREAAAQKQAWVSSLQQDLVENVHPELRLPGLVSEALHFEYTQLKKAKKTATRKNGSPVSAASCSPVTPTYSNDWDVPPQSHAQAQAAAGNPSFPEAPVLSTEEVSKLQKDVKRIYSSILVEVRRAVRSLPPPPKNGEAAMTVAQHQQNIANQGMQCFAGLLAYSDGVCSAMSDVRRHRSAANTESPLETVSGSPPLTETMSSGTLPRGTAVGDSGRVIPVSLSAQHGKAEKVAAIRRRGLVRHTPQQQRRASTPMFAPAPRRSLRTSIVLNGPTAVAMQLQQAQPTGAQ